MDKKAITPKQLAKALIDGVYGNGEFAAKGALISADSVLDKILDYTEPLNTPDKLIFWHHLITIVTPGTTEYIFLQRPLKELEALRIKRRKEYEAIEKAKGSKDEKPSHNKGGRPVEFPIEKTREWFIELSVNPDYQIHGRPYISKIYEAIRLRHQEAHKKNYSPSIDLIKDHRRKLRKNGEI